MSIPKADFRGKEFTVSMMELRSQPGEVFDCVQRGAIARVEKNGKLIAAIVPPSYVSGDLGTTIDSKGRIFGELPTTFKRDLGNGGYGR